MFKHLFLLLLVPFLMGAIPQEEIGFQYVLDPDLQAEYPGEAVCRVELDQLADVSVNDGVYTCNSYQMDIASEIGGVCTIGGGGGGGSGGGLNLSQVDARIAPWARTEGASGTIPPLRLPIIPPTKLGTGTASNVTFLRGDGSWQLPPRSGATETQIPSGTVRPDCTDSNKGAQFILEALNERSIWICTGGISFSNIITEDTSSPSIVLFDNKTTLLQKRHLRFTEVAGYVVVSIPLTNTSDFNDPRVSFTSLLNKYSTKNDADNIAFFFFDPSTGSEDTSKRQRYFLHSNFRANNSSVVFYDISGATYGTEEYISIVYSISSNTCEMRTVNADSKTSLRTYAISSSTCQSNVGGLISSNVTPLRYYYTLYAWSGSKYQLVQMSLSLQSGSFINTTSLSQGSGYTVQDGGLAYGMDGATPTRGGNSYLFLNTGQGAEAFLLNPTRTDISSRTQVRDFSYLESGGDDNFVGFLMLNDTKTYIAKYSGSPDRNTAKILNAGEGGWVQIPGQHHTALEPICIVGSDPPLDIVGIDGNCFFDETTRLLYVKSSGAWGAAVNAPSGASVYKGNWAPGPFNVGDYVLYNNDFYICRIKRTLLDTQNPLTDKASWQLFGDSHFQAEVYSFNNGQNAISRWSDLLGEHTVSVLVRNVENIPFKSGDMGISISGAGVALSPKTISNGVNVYTFRLNAADIRELATNQQTATALILQLYRGQITDFVSDLQYFPIDSNYIPPSLVVRVDNKAGWVALGETRNPNTWYYWSGGMARGFVQVSGEGIVPPPPDLNYLWDSPADIETSRNSEAPFTSGSGILARIVNVASGAITNSSTEATRGFFTWFMNRNFNSDNRPFHLATFTNSIITFGGQGSDWTNVRDFISNMRDDVRVVTRNTAGSIRHFSLKEATRNSKGRYTLPTDKSKYFRPKAEDPVDIAIIDGTNTNFSGL